MRMLLLLCLLLAACSPMPNLKDLPDASVGCVQVSGAAGVVRVVYIGTERGAVKDATVSVKGDCTEVAVTANQIVRPPNVPVATPLPVKP